MPDLPFRFEREAVTALYGSASEMKLAISGRVAGQSFAGSDVVPAVQTR